MSYLLDAISFAAALFVILAIVLLVRWSAADAKLRGKSTLLVSLIVLFLFPWGLIAWLLFRPEPPDAASPKRTFRLEDVRVQ
jgi:formate/nitrite transporter FocA (FNT family)